MKIDPFIWSEISLVGLYTEKSIVLLRYFTSARSVVRVTFGLVVVGKSVERVLMVRRGGKLTLKSS